MLSITTAAVHQPMCSNTTAQNLSPPRIIAMKERKWNCNINVTPKNQYNKCDIPRISSSSFLVGPQKNEISDSQNIEANIIKSKAQNDTINCEKHWSFREESLENNTATDVSKIDEVNDTKRKRKSEGCINNAIKFLKSVSVDEALTDTKKNNNIYEEHWQKEKKDKVKLWKDENIENNWDSLWEPDESLDISAHVPYYMTGFPNPPGENRCWLNATLHILFVLPLIDHLNCRDASQCSRLTKTLIALQLFWKQCPDEKMKTYQIVKKLKEELAILDESYPSQKQQDVSEFLMIFLNYIKSECEQHAVEKKSSEETENIPENELSDVVPKVLLLPSPLPSPIKKRQPLMSISPVKRINNIVDDSKKDSQIINSTKKTLITNNPIDHFFLLHMKEHYYCQKCNNHRERDIDNLMLYVDLPATQESETIDMAQAIAKSMDVEERNLACDKCKYSIHSVTTTFRKSPSVVIVQINRYGMISNGIVEKVNTGVKIPEELILQYTDEDGLTSRQRYEPTGLISHVGSAMDCGHYTSYVQHDNQWFYYNDINVTQVTRQDALKAAQTTVYLAFFVNVNLLSQSRDMSVTLEDPLR